jgi:hypothetical protein
LGFHKSRAHGDAGENFVISLLKSINITAEKNSDLTIASKYDIACQMGRKKFTGEVKFDRMAEKTDNIAIEIFNPKSNKHSGINITEADLWFHLIPDGDNITCWFNKTSAILKFIGEHAPKKTVELAGDQNATILLYSMNDTLDKVLFRLENLEPKQALKLVKEVLK